MCLSFAVSITDPQIPELSDDEDTNQGELPLHLKMDGSLLIW